MTCLLLARLHIERSLVSASSSVTRSICNVTHQGAARGGPVVLHSVSATVVLKCFTVACPQAGVGQLPAWRVTQILATLSVCVTWYRWRFGVVVMRWSRSTRLTYTEPS